MSDALPEILVLAAGRATRMKGVDKLLEPVPEMLGTAPLLQVVARRAAQAGRARVILGHGQDARAAVLRDLAVKITCVDPAAGMGASLAAGARAGNGALMVVLADMPEVTAADMHLLTALSAQAPTAILRAAAADGTPGHPVIFPADLRSALSALSGDTGARAILTAEAARVHLVPLAGRRAVVDLDTPADWAAWRAAQDTTEAQ